MYFRTPKGLLLKTNEISASTPYYIYSIQARPAQHIGKKTLSAPPHPPTNSFFNKKNSNKSPTIGNN